MINMNKYPYESMKTKAAAVPAPSIPHDLKCPVCEDLLKVRKNGFMLCSTRPTNLVLLKDCIMMPMCACSVCHECARVTLTEAENNNNACPACGTPDNSPEDLIPCRKVRERVNVFKSKNSCASEVCKMWRFRFISEESLLQSCISL